MVKHRKVSKYYENDYPQFFILLFMSLSTAPIVKNSHIYAKTLYTKQRNYCVSLLIKANLDEKKVTDNKPIWKTYQKMERYWDSQVLRKKCPYLELFWSIFSHIGFEYREILRICPSSVQIRENNSQYRHFSRSERFEHFLLEYCSKS